VADLSLPVVAWCLHGASQGDTDLYVMVNGSSEPAPFVIQEVGGSWHMVVDTARSSPDDIDLTRSPALSRPSYLVEPTSLVVLETGHLGLNERSTISIMARTRARVASTPDGHER
jgi:glycogen operon protein